MDGLVNVFEDVYRGMIRNLEEQIRGLNEEVQLYQEQIETLEKEIEILKDPRTIGQAMELLDRVAYLEKQNADLRRIIGYERNSDNEPRLRTQCN